MPGRRFHAACFAVSVLLHGAWFAWVLEPGAPAPKRVAAGPVTRVRWVNVAPRPAERPAPWERLQPRRGLAVIPSRLAPLPPTPAPPPRIEPPPAPEPPIAGVAFAPPALGGWATHRNAWQPAPPPDAAAWHAAQAAQQQRQQAAALAQLALAALQAQLQQWSAAAEAAGPCALPRVPDDAAPPCAGLPEAAWQQLRPAALAYYRQVPAAPGLQVAVGEGGWRLIAAP